MTYLTERQRDILQFIRDFQKERGVTPTHREICDHFGFSSYGTVYKHLSLLQKKGLIKRDWNQKRGVEVIEQAAQAAKPGAAVSAGVLELPLFGYIAAGQPLAVEISDETITVPERLTSRGENYVLKVRGDSMIDDGIMDGDYVITSRQRRDGRRERQRRSHSQASLPRRREGSPATCQFDDASDLCRCARCRRAGSGGRSDAPFLIAKVRIRHGSRTQTS